MMRRASRLAAMVVLGALAAGCDYVFKIPDPLPPDVPNQHFFGCFKGAATNTAKVTVVFEPLTGSTLSLGGCMQVMQPSYDATLAGMIDTADTFKARLTAMPVPAGSGVIDLRMQRQPIDASADAVTLSIDNTTSDVPFDAVLSLTRCSSTCADLGLPQAFLPEGTP